MHRVLVGLPCATLENGIILSTRAHDCRGCVRRLAARNGRWMLALNNATRSRQNAPSTVATADNTTTRITRNATRLYRPPGFKQPRSCRVAVEPGRLSPSLFFCVVGRVEYGCFAIVVAAGPNEQRRGNSHQNDCERNDTHWCLRMAASHGSAGAFACSRPLTLLFSRWDVEAWQIRITS
jgi:hypothetical protein